jgi:hypothetical protein
MKIRRDLTDLTMLTSRWRIKRDPDGLPVIPGRHGHVSAYDLETLLLYINGRPLSALLRELPPGRGRLQVGDRGGQHLLAPH